ncbi:MAG: DoxX family protein [Chloroflexota bacterium]|nr:MAG: DoxX family protein [Chloroflexota bacterium]
MKALSPDPKTTVKFADPPFAMFLFDDTRSAWIWLIVRLYLAYVWLSSGWGKLNNPAWSQTGEALKGFWEKALASGIYFDVYESFLQYLLNIQAWPWFAKLVIAGELFVGLTMLLGAFVGIGAFTGAILNFNFLLAGTVSSNPLLLILEILLVLAWKVAGWYGLDRYLLPKLGTPWAPGQLPQDLLQNQSKT